jgi:hypothetical protein
MQIKLSDDRRCEGSSDKIHHIQPVRLFAQSFDNEELGDASPLLTICINKTSTSGWMQGRQRWHRRRWGGIAASSLSRACVDRVTYPAR